MTRTLLASLILFLLTALGLAQDGVSTAGLARTKYLSTVATIPAPQDVVVEDFVNYHRHEIARPKAGQAVGLDLRWEKDRVAPNGEAVLQVGMSTALAHDTNELKPLNLSIVIDKSGSMSQDNKMVRVKEALHDVVSELRPSDTLSITVFDSNASVLLPACKVTDKGAIESVIDRIQPGSSTNLNSGLMLGYDQALKHYDEEGRNRVILLTDGIANQGITDPAQIARDSVSYNEKGIDLCTIGVGSDVNQEFLRKLATAGRGLFHYIENSDDIKKVFVDELQSQLQPVASGADLEIDYAPGLKLEQVYGYKPKIENGSVRLKLPTMNSGMTEAVLLRFKVDSEADGALTARAKLSYNDIDSNKHAEVADKASIAEGDGTANEDPSVKKDLCIARLAQAIHDMAADYEKQEPAKARKTLNHAIDNAYAEFPNLSDEDIKRTLAIAVRYRDALGTSSSEDGEDTSEKPLEQNIVPNGDFSEGNTHFLSGMEYRAPEDNGLWSGGYTIAPRFDSPFLHHLVAPGDYASPDRSRGNEQVMFANTGGTGNLTIWSTVVNCKPHTTYEVSFYAVSLSGSSAQNGYEIPTADWNAPLQVCVGGATGVSGFPGLGSYSKIGMRWTSGNSTSQTLSIVRLPFSHWGGLIGIADIKMVPVRAIDYRGLKD